MPDMLVRLYDMPQIIKEMPQQIKIKQALALDKHKILKFVGDNFSEGWVNECERAIFNNPISCYIATEGETILGFACYDTTAKGVFGPMGIIERARGANIGTALLQCCLNSMKEKGYAYGIIGWVTDAVDFYKKAVNAEIIQGSTPEHSIYINLI